MVGYVVNANNSKFREGVGNMKRNNYQNAFLQHIADMQEIRVEVTLGQHKLYEHENYEEIRKLLLDATHGMIYDIMEMIDGYSGYSGDKHDIVNTVTGEYLKENPFIELHDLTEDFLRRE